MKTSLKSAFTALGLAILAAFTFSSCETSGSASGSGTHEMGVKPGYQMQDKDMPSRQSTGTGVSAPASGTHVMGAKPGHQMQNKNMGGGN